VWTILIVDESESAFTELSETLRAALACKVLHAKDGGECLKMVETIEPDVILLGLRLPDTDSIDICGVLRKRDRMRRIPIILLTAASEDPENIANGLEAGADDYLILPADRLQVAARVSVAVKLKHSVSRFSEAEDSGKSLTSETAHALRSPLNSIMGLAELLQKPFFGPLTEKQKHFAETITAAGYRLLNLINELEQKGEHKE